ncbi:hypothetical protein MKJ01_03290 [Chryseobacterium sp. SSA4.19]|uniref:hypothetical protein n=1 Tax=Chryseobacterium sp. SSA4.19 TaxID=2919915 RepID=UPI001F4DD229|nr:hypothetical protein [Chryseobacterium sp. SSA4.19]MCJ8152789.1 hypothetical protein [Chryseobacterium sp. SSA4.19]
MVKFLFLLLCWLGTAAGTGSQEQEVKNSFKKFNQSYQAHKDHRKIPRSILSEHLLFYIDLAQKKENQSIENVKRSDSPTDKPDIIEGDVFSSLYEGFNEYKILSCTIKNNTARLKLELKNTHFKPIIVWNDDCILIKEKGIWKVDNFIFGKKDNDGKKNTQNIFRSFMHFEHPPIK